MKSLLLAFSFLLIVASVYSQQQSRLLYETDGSQTDSTHYYYSNGRGGGYYDADFMPWCHVSKVDGLLFELGNPSAIQYDSMVFFKKNQHAKYKVENTTLQLFNSSNQCISDEFQRFDEDSSGLIMSGGRQYSYDTQGNLTSVVYPPNINRPTYTRLHWTYDNNHKIITVSNEYLYVPALQWQKVNETFFTYDVYGKLVQANFKDYVESGHDGYVECTYDANNQLIQMESYGYIYQPATWLYNKRIYSFVYDNNGNNISGTVMGDTTGSPYLQYQYQVYYNANNLADSVIAYDYPNSIYSSKEIIRLKHNSFNQVTEAETEEWDITTNTLFSSGIRYYTYELHYPTATYEMPAIFASINVYPSPASESITLDIEWETVQQLHLTITDAVGRIWRKWTRTSLKSSKDRIDISALPSGNYWMTAEGENGKVTKQFSVIK